jgi:hypothetical protein
MKFRQITRRAGGRGGGTGAEDPTVLNTGRPSAGFNLEDMNGIETATLFRGPTPLRYALDRRMIVSWKPA